MKFEIEVLLFADSLCWLGRGGGGGPPSLSVDKISNNS